MNTIKCVWEHNCDDTLLYAVEYIGAYTRGETLKAAIDKMPAEIASYLKWRGKSEADLLCVEIVQDKISELNIKDADSDVLFCCELKPLTMDEYQCLKSLALKSAKDFLALYNSIPDKSVAVKSARKTFYGCVPLTAEEMYNHTKNVNEYYFAEIDVTADNDGDIYECRARGFANLERKENFLNNAVIKGSYGELWSLRKLLRRFIWHDRIHAKAMYRMAVQAFDAEAIANPFYFDN